MLLHDEIREFFDAYNECFYTKDIDALREFYDTDQGKLVFFDNHAGTDSYTLEAHLALLGDFFRNGKTSESGGVEPLLFENENIFYTEKSACICFLARYKSFLEPAMRCTYYLEKRKKRWKILHAHCSFQP